MTGPIIASPSLSDYGKFKLNEKPQAQAPKSSEPAAPAQPDVAAPLKPSSPAPVYGPQQDSSSYGKHSTFGEPNGSVQFHTDAQGGGKAKFSNPLKYQSEDGNLTIKFNPTSSKNMISGKLKF